MKRFIFVALAGLALSVLGGCASYSQEHPTTESRYMTPAEQAYWVERRWREDQADYWSRELARQSAVRMAHNFGN